MGTASRSVEILPLPQPKAVAKSAGGPTAPGRKRTLSGGLFTNKPSSNTLQTGTPFQGIMAMGLTQPALAALILIGKHATLNP